MEHPMSILLKPSTRRKSIRDFVESVVGDTMHSKRILSLCNAVEGVVHSTSLALSVVGNALATAQGLNPKHAVKQLDRFFSNEAIQLDTFLSSWVGYIVRDRKQIVVSVDWTEFDKDDQSTLALNLITGHGRASPLMWRTYVKSEMRGKRNHYEDVMLCKFRQFVSQDTNVVILADRGFADTAFFAYITRLGFDYVIRFKGVTTVIIGCEEKPAKSWLSPSGRARRYQNVLLTQGEKPVPMFVCVRDKKMKDAWYLASSLCSATATRVINLYSKRFTIEESFRDVKDIRFGMGLAHVSVKKPERRDRILIASAIASTLLTLLGGAGEMLGFDRLLKVNTVKTRTHSLLTQGAFYYQAMVNYKDERLLLLINKFGELMRGEQAFQALFVWE
jgi:hypothetical protein